MVSRICYPSSNVAMAKATSKRDQSKKSVAPNSVRRVRAGAVPEEALEAEFPKIDLPIQPPYPPMEAKSVVEIPSETGWLYEPKWDGFRCLAFRAGDELLLQSKSGQPLGRYFPELLEALRALAAKRFVLDGEIVIFSGGTLAFDELLQRIHPAESRIRKLAKETPCTFMCFDLLVDEKGKSLLNLTLAERRVKLEEFMKEFAKNKSVRLSPASSQRNQAEEWLRELGRMGLHVSE